MNTFREQNTRLLHSSISNRPSVHFRIKLNKNTLKKLNFFSQIKEIINIIQSYADLLVVIIMCCTRCVIFFLHKLTILTNKLS